MYINTPLLRFLTQTVNCKKKIDCKKSLASASLHSAGGVNYSISGGKNDAFAASLQHAASRDFGVLVTQQLAVGHLANFTASEVEHAVRRRAVRRRVARRRSVRRCAARRRASQRRGRTRRRG